MTYEEAEKLLSARVTNPGFDFPKRLKLQNHTLMCYRYELDNDWFSTDSRDIIIMFHQVRIVTLRRDGSESIADGGWRTQQTRSRINKYSNRVKLSSDWNMVIDLHKIREFIGEYDTRIGM